MTYSYTPHTDVAEFHRASELPVRTIPTTDISESERVLRARLVVEEALEFAEAMGFYTLELQDGTLVDFVSGGLARVYQYPDVETIDLTAAADALADIEYVIHGSAHTLGVPLADVFDIVHAANMRKVDPATGRVKRRESDGKVLKPDGWVAPDLAIAEYLASFGEPDEVASGQVHELKCWPEYFAAIWAGRKTFDVRVNDRDFHEGDSVYLREYDPLTETYSGRAQTALIGFVLSDGCAAIPAMDGHVVFSLLSPVEPVELPNAA